MKRIPDIIIEPQKTNDVNDNIIPILITNIKIKITNDKRKSYI